MIDFDDASRIENRLKQIGKGLLQDGGAYCDMYTGGAMHASFCASSPGLDSRLRQSGPVALFISLVLHGFIAVRMLGLFLVEVVLAIIDVFRGVIKGKNLWKELHFIPYRIGVCILLRELTTAGVLIDAALGLPIIHCNFLGYDEHAHRRGPSSTFAHLTLRGIDNCLRRIRDFSTSVASREYDLLIYSDHGQEATLPYEVLTCVSGASSFLRPLDLRQIVLQVLHRGTSQVQVSPHRRERPPQSVRVMTYNVHNCLGMDGRLSLERIARIITRYDPDVVALQEIDVNRARTGNVDQAHQIARMLNMEYHFHPSFMVKEE